MKEAKITAIILTMLLIFTIIIYVICNNYNIVSNICLSIIAGLVISLPTSITQYFIHRNNIKNKIFDNYFKLYKEIFLMEENIKRKTYLIQNFMKALISINAEIQTLLNSYSGFIKNSKYLKKINPDINIINYKINKKTLKDCMKENNKESVDKLIIPLKSDLEDLMRGIDKNKFDIKWKEYHDSRKWFQ